MLDLRRTQPDQLLPTDVERTYGIRVNGVNLTDLFALYERTGFLYPAKAVRLMPYFDRVRANWRRLLEAGESLLYVLTAGDEHDGLASIAVWRTTHDGWTWQHLVSEGDPIQSRALMLGGLVRCMQQGNEKSQQNWFRPENRFPARVFGTMGRSLGESLSSVRQYEYFALPRPSASWADRSLQIVPYRHSHHDALRNLALVARGDVYWSAEDLERDVELQAVDELYRRVSLSRTRHVWLAYRHGTDEAVAAAIAYRGPLGLNFSFIENRCDLLLHPSLQAADVEACVPPLLQAAAAAYGEFELDDIPIVADHAAAPVLSAMGARLLRHYTQGIWLREGQPALYRHVDGFYRRLVDRASRRSAQPATLTA